jgi:hypothetical protein
VWRRWLISVGGADRTVCQWIVQATGRDQKAVTGPPLQPLVLAPPPRFIVDMGVIEYAADGSALEDLEEGVVDEPPAVVDKAETLLVSVVAVTADAKCASATDAALLPLRWCIVAGLLNCSC